MDIKCLREARIRDWRRTDQAQETGAVLRAGRLDAALMEGGDVAAECDQPVKLSGNVVGGAEKARTRSKMQNAI
jgi:hypothetical protein